MSSAPQLLNSDGTASVATAILMSHHGLRRDIRNFATALTRLEPANTARVSALRDEWQRYRGTLHGHHLAEDSGLFPYLKSQHPDLAAVIEQLAAEHRQIDPLLEQGDHAFTQLPQTAAAIRVVAELEQLLAQHLAHEEGSVVPYLRREKHFPPPNNDAEADLHAQGFAWSSHGIAPEVLEQVYAMLPEILTSRLPGARAAFAVRCEAVWGSAHAGTAHTAIPEAV